MEKRLKCVLMLSLKEMALRRVSVLLSNEYEISCRSFNSISDWVRWINRREEKVKYKISKLLIPESLRKEMIDKVRPITLEIRKFLCFYLCFEISTGEIDIPAKWIWTSAGTIDYKKTVAFLACKVLDVEKRYTLASRCCLEDYIPLLWEELPEDRKEFFLSGTCLDSFWPRILKGEISGLDHLWRKSEKNLTSFNQWAFEDSAIKANKMVAECFFRKLTHEEREASLMRTTLNVLSNPTSVATLSFTFFYELLCFLLSSMTPKQQMEAIKRHPVPVLLCFYVMFYQDLLVENSGAIWSLIPTSDYGVLLVKILIIERLNFYHPNSFREFFKTSPPDFKKYFVHEHIFEFGEYGTPAARFLDDFFRRENSDSIKCIFRNVDVADRVAIVFNRSVLNLFYNSLKDRRLMVKMCLREAMLSKEDRERLKMDHPYLKIIIEELDESDATADKERKGQKRKLEKYCSE